MKNEISKKLLELNFDPGYKGFFFLVEVLTYKKEMQTSSLNDIYEELAREHQTSPAAIARNLKTCITKSDNEYNYKTVNEVVSLLSVIL